MIARWHFEARFGYKAAALELIKQWNAEIGSQTDIDMSAARITTGSVGAKESHVEVEFPIADLSALQGFFDKIATIQMHEDWGPRMGEVIVSGSTHWQVHRVIE